MGRLILFTFIFLFTNCLMAGEMPIEQQEAGKWVSEEKFKSLVESQIKENLNEDEKLKCENKLIYYSKKLENKPDSEYYKHKLEKYIKRCTK